MVAVLTVSAEENEDLYWGIRGAGARISESCRRFQYRLHPVGPVPGRHSRSPKGRRPLPMLRKALVVFGGP